VIDLEALLARGPLRVRSVWSGEQSDRAARRILRRRRAAFVVDTMAAAFAFALIAWVGGSHGRFPAGGLAHGAAIAAPGPGSATRGGATTGEATTFADGSVAELGSGEAQLQIEEDTPRRVVARLRGGARFRVVPNPERTFQVQAGDVRVRVLGTVFSLQELGSGQTQVLVQQGRVEVAWVGGAAVLLAGQGGVFPPGEDRPAEDAPSSRPAGAPDAPAGEAIAGQAPDRAARPVRGRPEWREYAARGEYDRAYALLRAAGAGGVPDDAGDLLLAADVARLSGHPDQAVAPLRSLCDRHAGDRRAPVAAFTLGRVLLDDLGRAPEAADAFHRARLLWPGGPLAEDALAREAEAWQRAGELVRASEMARAYRDRYPRGRHLAALATLLAQ